MYPLPVGPTLELSQHDKMLPELKHSPQHLQVRILLQVVAVVKAAWTSGLHVCYPLMLDRPWVRSPAVHIHIQ